MSTEVQKLVWKQDLLRVASAVDSLVGDLAREITDYPVGSFRSDMHEALSGDTRVPFTVEEVLDAMHNWSVIAFRRLSQHA